MALLDDDVRPAMRAPTSLHRQQLIRLSGPGWAHALAAPWDATAQACLQLWAERGLPLVVTRQRWPQEDAIASGLPAPARFGRRRIALAVRPQDVLFFDEFLPADAASRLLPRDVATPWRALLAGLAAIDCAARVYGGYGWQAITRLAYVHVESDLDLLLPVNDAAHADAVVRGLACAEDGWRGPRLDGELLFPDGGAVAWREWQAHRSGLAAQVLVKRLHGVALEVPA